MAEEKEYKFVRFPLTEYGVVQEVIDEVKEESSRRVYDYQVIVDAAAFYKKYRKFIEGAK